MPQEATQEQVLEAARSLDGDEGFTREDVAGKQVKAKKGKHGFSVRAKDAAGNIDQSPARYSWKVKKRRKRP